MRSHESDEYYLLKDGNFQLTLSRILASDYDSIVMTIPTRVADMEEFESLVASHPSLSKRLKCVRVEYGINAVNTRETFYQTNREILLQLIRTPIDLVITDITGFYKLGESIPHINNFNVTKLDELDRPYVDKFFDEDLKSIEAAKLTTVINEKQREKIISVRPDLATKVVSYTMVAHEDLLPKQNTHETFEIPGTTYDRMIFWPFRISDKAYKFQDFLKIFVEEGLYREFDLVITDPNDSYTGTHAFIKKIKPTKEQYYKILSSCPMVVMLDDIDLVLHPGTIEFFYYSCPIITFRNQLIDHANQIITLDEIPHVLRTLYLETKDMSKFIYKKNQISKIYRRPA